MSSLEQSTQPETCPRCGRARHSGEDACPRCGLLVVRWRTFRPDADDPPGLQPLWEGLVAAWSDAAAHDRALAVASNLAALPALARRYRARLAADAGDEMARERLQRVAVLVETGARAQAEEQVQRSSLFRVVYFAGYVVGVMGMAVAAYVLFIVLRQRH